jgi:hypothetical protein
MAPTEMPLRIESLCMTNAITVEMPEILSFTDEAGGAEITSYNLEFNGGAGSTFYEVTGQTFEQLNRVITVVTVPGETYLFRYRIKNIFGLSAGYSPVSKVKSAKAPNMPLTATTSIDGNNIKIEWTPSSENFDAISRFNIEIKTSAGEWL